MRSPADDVDDDLCDSASEEGSSVESLMTMSVDEGSSVESCVRADVHEIQDHDSLCEDVASDKGNAPTPVFHVTDAAGNRMQLVLDVEWYTTGASEGVFSLEDLKELCADLVNRRRRTESVSEVAGGSASRAGENLLKRLPLPSAMIEIIVQEEADVVRPQTPAALSFTTTDGVCSSVDLVPSEIRRLLAESEQQDICDICEDDLCFVVKAPDVGTSDRAHRTPTETGSSPQEEMERLTALERKLSSFCCSLPMFQKDGPFGKHGGDSESQTRLLPAALQRELRELRSEVLQGLHGLRYPERIRTRGRGGGDVAVRILSQCALLGLHDIVEWLILAGVGHAAPPAGNPVGSGHCRLPLASPLHAAAANIADDPRVLSAIAAIGCPLEGLIRSPGHDSNFPSQLRGRTPLEFAVGQGNFQCAKELLVLGADANCEAAGAGNSLHFATSKGMVKLLLDAGARVSDVDHAGDTPLCRLCKSGARKIWSVPTGLDDEAVRCIRLLLDAGASLHVKSPPHSSREDDDDDGFDLFLPLHHICDTAVGGPFPPGSLTAARMLLDSGADINAKSNWGTTALHCAAGATRDARAMLELLLDAGAHEVINLRDQDGLTPMHCALWYLYQDKTEAPANCPALVLVENGADIDGTEIWKEHSAVDECRKRGYANLADAIARAAANRRSQDGIPDDVS